MFIENAQCDKAITTLEYKRFVQLSSLTTKWPAGIKKWLATDSLVKAKVKVDESKIYHMAGDEEIAFIQYTSGSTGFEYYVVLTLRQPKRRSSTSCIPITLS